MKPVLTYAKVILFTCFAFPCALRAQQTPPPDLAYHKTSPMAGHTLRMLTGIPHSDESGEEAESLSSFTASFNSRGIRLAWSAGQPSNKNGYEIERSVGGSSFIRIGKVTAGMHQHFQFLDRFIYQPSYYYRIKIISPSGKATYSRTLLVNRKNSTAAPASATILAKKTEVRAASAKSVSSRPAEPLRLSMAPGAKSATRPLKITGTLRLQVNAPGNAPIHVSVSGHNGRIGLQREFANSNGSSLVVLEGLDLLPKGKYTIVLQCGNQVLKLPATR